MRILACFWVLVIAFCLGIAPDRLQARDTGPGIPDVSRALEDGYSTYEGLGLGLPGARRLMDEFTLESEPGRGTTVSMTKWFDQKGRR